MVCVWGIVFSEKKILYWEWLGCALFWELLEWCVLTLLVYWNHIDKYYQVVMVEGDSYKQLGFEKESSID